MDMEEQRLDGSGASSTNTVTGACAMELGSGSPNMESDDSRRTKLLQSEVDRVKMFPASSSYAIHRLRVLNKMLELLKIDPKKRTKPEVDELELLFAGLSL